MLVAIWRSQSYWNDTYKYLNLYTKEKHWKIMSIVLWRCLHKQNYCDFIDRWFIFQWVTDMYKANIVLLRKRKSKWKFYGSILSCLWDRHNLRLLNYYKFSEWQKYKFFLQWMYWKETQAIVTVVSDLVLWWSFCHLNT